jgi:hypothetical protein
MGQYQMQKLIDVEYDGRWYVVNARVERMGMGAVWLI